MATPCPDCGGQAKLRGTYVERNSGDSLVIRGCPTCRSEWVHAKKTGRWYKLRRQEANDSRAEGEPLRPDLHRALPDSRAHRLGRLVAIFDVANELAGVQTRYIERHVETPKFVCRNWKLECETNAISALESIESRQKLDALIQKHLEDADDMRSEENLSVEEQKRLAREYRRYKKALAKKFDLTVSW